MCKRRCTGSHKGGRGVARGGHGGATGRVHGGRFFGKKRYVFFAVFRRSAAPISKIRQNKAT